MGWADATAILITNISFPQKKQNCSAFLVLAYSGCAETEATTRAFSSADHGNSKTDAE